MPRMIKRYGLPGGVFLAALLMSMWAGPSLGSILLRTSQTPTGHCDCDCNPETGVKDWNYNCRGEGLQGSYCPKSMRPVKFGSGENMMSIPLLSNGGMSGLSFGMAFVHDPIYADATLGQSLREASRQRLLQDGDVYKVLRGHMPVRSFRDNFNGTFTPTQPGFLETFTANTGAQEFKLEGTSGAAWIFHDFSKPMAGQLKEVRDQHGNATTFVYGLTPATVAYGKVLEMQQTDPGAPGVLHKYLYDYNPSGASMGMLASVTYQRSTGGPATTVRQVLYEYHTVPLNEVKWIRVTDGTAQLEAHYFRYTYINRDLINRFIGVPAVSLILNSSGYDRALAAYGTDPNIEAQSNTVLEQWAEYKFTYDVNGRVASETVQGEGCGCGSAGGKGTYTFYHEYGVGPGYHGFTLPTAWWHRSFETEPGGLTRIVYTNLYGWKMLETIGSITKFHFYTANGQLSGVWMPSNEGTYQITDPLLRPIDGVYGQTMTYAYYAATDLPNGAVKGYMSLKIEKNVQTDYKYVERVVGTSKSYHLASETVYAGPGLTNPRTISYAYTFPTSSHQPSQKVVTYPTVTAGNNGSGTATTETILYDTYGRETWRKDEENFLHYREYDILTGALKKQIRDVNTATLPNPLGWTTPAGGGLHLSDDYEVDTLGRTTKHTDAGGRITFVVHKDVQEEKRIYAGWNGTTTPTVPTIVIREDGAKRYHERIGMTAPIDIIGGVPTGNEAIANVQSLEREYLDTGDRVTHRDSYFQLAAYSPNVPLGGQGTDYYRMVYNYDLGGRKDRVVDWTGTVSRSVHDIFGRVTSQWIGTDDTPTTGDWSPGNVSGTNLVKTTEYEYDGNTGKGDGLLTKVKRYTSAGVSLDTLMQYDKGTTQRTGVKGPDGVARKWTFDGLNRPTVEETYVDGGTAFVIDAGELRRRNETAYDEKGQVWKSVVQEADPSTGVSPGTLRERLTTTRWYTARGQLAKTRSPNGQFQKALYDGAGRLSRSFVSYDDAENTYALALTVASDTVWQEDVYTLDGSGNELQRTSYARVSGVAKTGDLATSWAVADSRRTFVLNWFDTANRLTNTVDYGTNNGANVTRPGTIPAPNSSNNYLVTKYEYTAGGHVHRVTNNLAKIQERAYDLLGRETSLIENWVNGATAETELDTDRKTTRIYDSSGRMSQLIAHNPKGTGLGVEQQVTKYVYGFTSATLNRNDMLVAEIYPDSDDVESPLGNGADTVYDRIEYTYDYAGRRATMKDQRGLVHTYAYDSVGRTLSDAVTTLPAGVDGGVQRIQWGYDELSRVNLISSYDLPSAGNIVNQVKSTYDGWGNVAKSEQSHVGAVTGGTPAYQVTYAEGGTPEALFVRPSIHTYPNGRQVHVNYTGPGDDRLSRPTSYSHLAGGGAPVFAQWTYQGLGRIQKVEHPQNGLTLSYGTGGNPTGWDRFGRVLQQNWGTNAAPLQYEAFTYTYDRMSNPLTKDRTTSGGPTDRDEQYTYDGLHRLKTMKRGTLAGTSIANTASTFNAEWNALESLGNWRTNRWDANGGVGSGGTIAWTTQTRKHNKANEIDVNNNDADAAGASITGTNANWVDPVYDKSGNMKSAPVPNAETTRHHYTYDAWNRLVKVQADNAGVPGTTVAEYQYDGRTYRTCKLVANGGNWDRTDYYYNTSWQVLEERTLTTASKTTVATAIKYQYVWDLRYIDALVLRDENKDADGDCIDGTDQRLYYVQDANYNVTTLVDVSGAVVERVQYDAYGKHVLYNPAWSATQLATAYNNQILFASYRYDAESGLHQVRHRLYHASLGRWLGRDPIKFGDGQNMYQYANSRSISFVDPSGLQGGAPVKGGECCLKYEHFWKHYGYQSLRDCENNYNSEYRFDDVDTANVFAYGLAGLGMEAVAEKIGSKSLGTAGNVIAIVSVGIGAWEFGTVMSASIECASSKCAKYGEYQEVEFSVPAITSARSGSSCPYKGTRLECREKNK